MPFPDQINNRLLLALPQAELTASGQIWSLLICPVARSCCDRTSQPTTSISRRRAWCLSCSRWRTRASSRSGWS